MGQDEWDCARILAGRPAVGAELTEDFNPLEAGLCKAVSVDKVRWWCFFKEDWPAIQEGVWAC
eukprot:scaffold217711_cov17-Tisochrysis_lutea.AAC.1